MKMAYKNSKNLDRRDLLKAVAGSFVAWHAPAALSLPALQSNNGLKPSPKLVWIMLRGAMDSLHAILPLSDPDLMLHRKKLVSVVKSKAFDLG
jgi:uncharacterized protein (DUF1501 family)